MNSRQLFIVRRLLLLLLALPHYSLAEVTSQDASGFEIALEQTVKASQAQSYAQFIRVGEWWISDHTWFGSSKNLSINPVAGGCFCERNGDKQALHMTVSYVVPDRELRMIGGLGPLQQLGVHGGMTWQFVQVQDGLTRIVLNYKVAGRSVDGLDKLAAAVDGVLAQQLAKLAELLNVNS